MFALLIAIVAAALLFAARPSVWLADKSGIVAQLAEAKTPPAEAVEQLYLRTFSRRPRNWKRPSDSSRRASRSSKRLKIYCGPW